jgi:hypothetical protein
MSTSETPTNWTEELPVSGRAASNLEDEYGSVEELITAYREAEDITDISYVGSATMRDLREIIHERDPDAERARKENDEAICTEYTTWAPDEPEDGVFYFAFICPRCEGENPLKGDPDKFRGRPFRCEECGWVPLLEGDSLNRFSQEVETDVGK